MDRSSKSITLALIGSASVALIGSAFLLKGCEADREESEWGEDGQQQAVAGRHGGGGVFIAPMIGRGLMGGGRGGVAPAPSARGGFGASGSAGVGSGVGS